MFIARVIGSVVSTKKDEAMEGRKLLLLRPLLVDEAKPDAAAPGLQHDRRRRTASAPGSTNWCCSARAAPPARPAGMKTLPVDAVVIGIIDTVDVLSRKIYPAT